MKHESKMQLLWGISFVTSGIIFGLAFVFTPYIGALAVAGYIVLYIGLASAFLMVFKGLTRINSEVIRNLEERRAELDEMKESVRKKYFKKKIDQTTFEKLEQDYERQLTEIEAKIHQLRRI